MIPSQICIGMFIPAKPPVVGIERFVGDGTSATPAYVALYEDAGTFVMHDDTDAELVHHYDRAENMWVDIHAPEELLKSFPPTQDTTQHSWKLFYCAFVARGLRGDHTDYPTFCDRWTAMEIIDTTQTARGWVDLQT